VTRDTISMDEASARPAGGAARRPRRAMLAGAAGALGVVAAETLARATPAQATQGAAVLEGKDNTGATSRTGVFTTGNSEFGILADPDTSGKGSLGVYGHGKDVGVLGNTNTAGNGTGLHGFGFGSGIGGDAGGAGVSGIGARGGPGMGGPGIVGFGTGGNPGVIGETSAPRQQWSGRRRRGQRGRCVRIWHCRERGARGGRRLQRGGGAGGEHRGGHRAEGHRSDDLHQKRRPHRRRWQVGGH
jgi:hypothetical protein